MYLSTSAHNIVNLKWHSKHGENSIRLQATFNMTCEINFFKLKKTEQVLQSDQNMSGYHHSLVLEQYTKQASVSEGFVSGLQYMEEVF